MGRYIQRSHLAEGLEKHRGLRWSDRKLDKVIHMVNETAPWLSEKRGGYKLGVSRHYSWAILDVLLEVDARTELAQQWGGLDHGAAEEHAIRSIGIDLKRMPAPRWPIPDAEIDRIQAALVAGRGRANQFHVAVEEARDALEMLRTRFGVETTHILADLDRAVATVEEEERRRAANAIRLTAAAR